MGALTQFFEIALRCPKMQNSFIVKNYNNKNHLIFNTNFNIRHPVEMTRYMCK